MLRAVVVAVVVVFAVGCSSGSPGEDSRSADTTDASAATTSTTAGAALEVDDSLPSSIECGTQYRPHADNHDGAEEPTLTVEPTGPVAAPETLTFPTMTLSVSYGGDEYEGHSVYVTVTADTGEPLVNTLYQLGGTRLDEVDFAGGHGFTGLQYVSHGEALLQVWCKANP
jgi:hypothetical protein